VFIVKLSIPASSVLFFDNVVFNCFLIVNSVLVVVMFSVSERFHCPFLCCFGVCQSDSCMGLPRS